MAKTETLTTDVALGATIDARGVGAIPEWLGRRYRVTRVLGRGGMGAVYHAIDQALEIEVALKQVLVPGNSLARLRDEVRLAQRVTHPNVCRTYDLEELDGNWLVKMEYVDGATLAQELKSSGALALARAIAIARDVCAGLAAAHKQGVIHCDLKPHNIMIESATGRVVLMDFGIARAEQTERGKSPSGTPEYMAPEQVRGEPLDGRTDLYALGCVLYEMIAGKRVFQRDTRAAVARAHANDPPPPLPGPERIRRVVARLLEKEPAKRYASADELAVALADRPRRIGWWLAAGALAAAAVAIAVLGSRSPKHWQANIQELPSYFENSEAPVLSPDARQYAYQSDREETGRYRIFAASFDGGSPHAITPRDVSAINPRWQRDGRAILFSDLESGRAMSIALAGGAPESIAEDVQWLDDCGGRLLLGYNSAPGCPRCGRLVVRERGTEREITRFPSGAKLFNPRCDRAGTRALYSVSDGAMFGPHEQYDLWLVPLDGGAARRLTNDHTGTHGTFTPDDKSIVFGSMRTGQWHLWEMPVDGGVEPVQRTFGEGWEAQPDIAPDGRFLIYSVDVTTVQLYARPFDGGAVRQLTSKAQDLRHPQLTSDGRTIIAESTSASTLETSVVSVSADGGDPLVLFAGTAPVLTPDETEIVYCDGPRIAARPRAGGPPRIIAELAGRPITIEIGPDARVHAAVASSDGSQAWSAPLAGGPATRELAPPWAFLSHAPRSGWRAVMTWTGDLRRVRFVPPGARLDAPSPRELTGLRALAWMPDGKSMLYVRERTNVHQFFVESGEDRIVAQGGDLRDIVVSPDGATIITSQVLAHVRRQIITNFGDRPPVE